MKRATLQHDAPAADTMSYAGYRFPADVIGYAVWPYYRFPWSLPMVEELLAARGIELTYEMVRRWLDGTSISGRFSQKVSAKSLSGVRGRNNRISTAMSAKPSADRINRP